MVLVSLLVIVLVQQVVLFFVAF